MTNSPQIPTVPQDVMDAIENYAYACSSAAQDMADASDRKERADCKQFLLTAIVSHLRPVVPDEKVSNSTPLIEVEKLVESLIRKTVSIASRYKDAVYIDKEFLSAKDAVFYAIGHRAYPMGPTKSFIKAAHDLRAEKASEKLESTQPNKSSALPDESTLLDIIAEKQANGWEYGAHPREKAKIVLDAIRPYFGALPDVGWETLVNAVHVYEAVRAEYLGGVRKHPTQELALMAGMKEAITAMQQGER